MTNISGGVISSWLGAWLAVVLVSGSPLQANDGSVGCGNVAPSPPGETTELTLNVGEMERRYRLRLPRAYDGSSPVSLVLHFHGYTGTAASTEEHSGLSQHADEEGYAVVYPQSTSFEVEGREVTSWNDLAGSRSPGPEGPICNESASRYPHPPECGEPVACNWATCHDDVGFVDALLDRLEETICVDRSRIYATGMSNGGMFVHRLGCEMPKRFAAIAPVGGTLARGFNCAPGRDTPLSMLNVYGRNDDYVSQKGVVSSDGYYYTGAADLLERWADAQGCQEVETSYPASADVLGLTCVQRDGCATGTEVVHCEWEGGHDWPGETGRAWGNALIWDFFARHSRTLSEVAQP